MDLCTENLCCESGTNIDDVSIDSDVEVRQEDTPSWSFSPARSSRIRRPETTRRSYPPPLTSINSIAVKACREDGRLVIRALPSCARKVFSERSNGRLILRLVPSPLKVHVGSSEDEVVEATEENGHGREEDEEDLVMKSEGDQVLGGCEMGVADKLKRPSRCKEGDKGFISLGTFCVASS